MIDFIKVCGIVGILSPVTTFVLLVAAAVVITRSTSPKTLLILGLVGLLPLLMGILGTAAGNSQTAKAQESMASVEQTVIQSDYEHARYTTWLGAGCTALLWVIVGGAACLKNNQADCSVETTE